MRALFILLLLATVKATHNETSRWCMLDVPGNSGLSGSCTANDVFIAQAISLGSTSCVAGQKVQIKVRAQMIATANVRYSVASYFALDGGDATRGTCYPYFLHPVTTVQAQENPCSSNATTSCNGPFPSLDGDACGDIRQGQSLWFEFSASDYVCQDSDGNGVADFSVCTGWGNQANGACTGIGTALVSTSSKCNCGTVNIGSLSVCASDQPSCYGDDGQPHTSPCQPRFSARLKVTTSQKSSFFPPNSVLYGSVFLDFFSDQERMAIQYFYPPAMPAQFAIADPTSVIIREDILHPCKTNNRVNCSTTCSSSFNKNLVPRLFHEGSYQISSTAYLPDSTDCSQAPALGISFSAGVTCFKKTLLSSASGISVAYIWACNQPSCGAQNTGIWEVQAAYTLDGTVWELFRNQAGSNVRGVSVASLVTPCVATPFQVCPAWQSPAAYDFSKLDLCAGSLKCSNAVQFALAVDEQYNYSSSAFLANIKPYLTSALNAFAVSGSIYNTALGGIAWSNGGSLPAFNPTTLTSSQTTLANAVSNRAPAGGNTDFRKLVVSTINQFWPTNSGTTPRVLVVIVGGPDAYSSGITWADTWLLYQQRNVTVYVAAFGFGASDMLLLTNITGGNASQVFTFKDASSLQKSDSDFMWRRMCPSTSNICPCNGFCSCTLSSDCVCPSSCNSNDACFPTTCSTPVAGCAVQGGLNCQGSDVCVVYGSCVDSNGPFAPGGSASCTANTPRVCSTNDLCLQAYCDSSVMTGDPCKTTPIGGVCNDNNTCTVDTCSNSTCSFSPLVCTTNDKCLVASCSQGVGCVLTPKSGAALAAVCNDNNSCTLDSCSNNACSYTALSCSQPTDICQKAVCDSVLGCQIVPKSQSEIAGICNDNDPCTFDWCTSNQCQFTRNVTCTQPTDICREAVCVAGTGCVTQSKSVAQIAALCNDNNACTTDTCFSNACIYTPLTCAQPSDICQKSLCSTSIGCYTTPKTQSELVAVCNDNDPCTFDWCTGGQCQYTRNVTCAQPSDMCMEAICISPGGCTTQTKNAAQITALCNDNNACTTDSCSSNQCINTPLTCTQPSDICQKSVCASGIGCYFTPKTQAEVSAVCNDNDPCTFDWCTSNQCQYTRNVTCAQPSDICLEAVCVAGSGCQIRAKSGAQISALCNDLDACTTDTCSSNACVYTPVVCSQPSDICQKAVCDRSSGCYTATKTLVEVSAVCNDNDPCTLDWCTSNQCQYTRNITCTQPSDVCLQAICVAGTGCVTQSKSPAQIAVLCNDNNACTTDTCSGNQCVYSPLSCAASADICVGASCDTMVGCIYTPKTGAALAAVCNDGNACTVDTCSNNQCFNSTSVTCATPSDICLESFCDTLLGCGTRSKTGAALAAVCNDNKACTVDSCSNNQCIYTPLVCTASSDKCLVAECAEPGGCRLRNLTASELAAVCNDGDACTVDSCVGNTCIYSRTVICTQPIDICQESICVSPGGCVTQAKNATVLAGICNDNDACTTDSCSSNQCIYTPVTCTQPTDICQKAVCITSTGCVVAPKTQGELLAVCNDNDPCTFDWCTSNQCQYTRNVTCAQPSDICLEAVCVAGSGCQIRAKSGAQISALCNDLDACTTDSCSSNACVYTPVVCSQPSDICQKAVCASGTGCYFTPKTQAEVSAVCNDNDPCTLDWCTGGQCQYTRNVTCTQPSDVCLQAICVAGTGCVTQSKSPAQIASLCNDNNACTTDTCSGNQCVYSPSVLCPASNACASFSCNSTSGQCVSSTLTCNDNDFCTTDSCDTMTGCVFTPGNAVSICNPGSCQTATCNANACVFTNVTTGVCSNDPCVANPCSQTSSYCFNAVCINTVTGSAGWDCQDLSTVLAASCTAAVTSSFPNNRYCYLAPTNVCAGMKTQCNNVTCVDTGGLSGRCDVADTSSACVSSSICKTASCDAVLGCVLTDKAPAEISVLCNDGNACTVDTCSNNQCLNSTSVTCTTPSDICLESFCDHVLGCSTRPKTGAALTAVCNDNKACTVDSCSNNQCIYTPLVCTASSDKCLVAECAEPGGCRLRNLTASELAAVCNDGDACTVDSCVSNMCVYSKTVICTQPSDICQESICVSPGGCVTQAKNATVLAGICNDNNACTTDTCSNNQCIYAALTCIQPNDICKKSLCDSGIGCYLASKTQAEVSAVCNDNDPCTFDWCTGNQCHYTANVTCAQPSDICQEAICVAGSGCVIQPKSLAQIAVLCNDNNACTTDSCSNNACFYTPITCTQPSDICQKSVCASGIGCYFTPKTQAEVSAVCNDNDPCTFDWCTSNQCQYTRNVTCAQPSDICLEAVCVAGSGCVTQSKNALTIALLCSDNNACSTDSCSNSSCVYTPVVCAPSSDMCLSVSCNPTLGCIYTPKTGAALAAVCNDNNACTVDTCSNNQCFNSTSVTCASPSDICLESFCDQVLGCSTRPKTGAALAAVCNDNKACTTDSCSSNQCIYTPLVCTASSDKCLVAECAEPGGCRLRNLTASELAAVCNDGDACTVDSCIANSCIYSRTVTCGQPSDICQESICVSPGGCVTQAKNATVLAQVCNDNNACTTDTCSNNACIYTPLVCSLSADMCLTSTCNTTIGCIYAPKTGAVLAAVCNDNNACTVDTCSNNQCLNSTSVTCTTPSDICLESFCDTLLGCGTRSKTGAALTAVCNDNKACTTDSCSNNQCIYAPVVCTASSDKCLVAECAEPGGCRLRNLTASELAAVCNDGDACTVDSCIANTCIYSRTVTCGQPSDICQESICVSPGGCTTQAKSAAQIVALCNDNNACTVDSCSSNQCIYTPVTCTQPSDMCQKSVCDSGIGCLTLAKTQSELAGLCNDNDPCTFDWCTGNQCQYTRNVTCVQPSDICQEAICVAGSGCVIQPKSSAQIAALCNDNDACTTDTCSNNACVYTPLTCTQPNDICQKAVCDRSIGCYTTVKTLAEVSAVCNDNDLCTVDWCSGNQCQYTRNVTCTQPSDACLEAVCVAGSGCQTRQKDVSLLCNDGNACTMDSCSNGLCVYSPVVCTSSDKCLEAFCDGLGGCSTRQKSGSALALVCNDNNACTIDTCVSNMCLYSVNVTCPVPSNICFESFCDAVTGCNTRAKAGASLQATCEDNNACTADSCVGGACVYTMICSISASLPDSIWTVGSDQSVSVATLAGTAPFQFVVVNGSLPPGLALDQFSGVISGVPSGDSVGSFSCFIRVSDRWFASVVISCSFVVRPEITLSQLTPSVASAGFPFSGSVGAQGGSGSGYSFSVSGGNLPAGLMLSIRGSVSGIPTAQGISFFTVSVSDSEMRSQSSVQSMNVLPVLQLGGLRVNVGSINIPYSGSFSASGGSSTAYVFSIVNGTVPPGFSLSASSGAFSGVPTAAGSFVFGVRVQDSLGAWTYLQQSFVISLAPVLVSPVSAGGTVGFPFSAQFLAGGGSGSGYVFSLVSGTLPTGLIFSIDGTISGTPTAVQQSSVTVQVRDSFGGLSSGSALIQIFDPPVLNGSMVMQGSTASVFDAQFGASGGAGGPFEYGVIGTLPEGVSLDKASGKIYGIPSVASSSTFDVVVKDKVGGMGKLPQVSICICPVTDCFAYGCVNGQCTASPTCASVAVTKSSACMISGAFVTLSLDFLNDGYFDIRNPTVSIVRLPSASYVFSENVTNITCWNALSSDSGSLSGVFPIKGALSCVARYKIPAVDLIDPVDFKTSFFTNRGRVIVTNVQAARPKCSMKCTCACKNGDWMDTDGSCKKICKNKQGCCWLSTDRSCSAPPPECDAKPDHVFSDVACVDQLDRSFTSVGDEFTEDFCECNGLCHSINSPYFCNSDCPAGIGGEGCGCNSLRGNSRNCRVISQKVEVSAGSATAVPVLELNGTDLNVGVGGQLSCNEFSMSSNSTLSAEVDPNLDSGPSVSADSVNVDDDAKCNVKISKDPTKGGKKSSRGVVSVGVASGNVTFVSFTLMTFRNITGTFTQVQADASYPGSDCDNIVATPVQTATSLSVVLQISKRNPPPTGCPSLLNGAAVLTPPAQTEMPVWAIVLIVFGGGLLCIVGIAMFLSWRRRHHLKSMDKMFREKITEKARTGSISHVSSSSIPLKMNPYYGRSEDAPVEMEPAHDEEDVPAVRPPGLKPRFTLLFKQSTMPIDENNDPETPEIL